MFKIICYFGFFVYLCSIKQLKKIIMKKTIFKDNKTFSSVLLEAALFSVSSVLVLTFLAAFLTLILNLIY